MKNEKEIGNDNGKKKTRNRFPFLRSYELYREYFYDRMNHTWYTYVGTTLVYAKNTCGTDSLCFERESIRNGWIADKITAFYCPKVNYELSFAFFLAHGSSIRPNLKRASVSL